MRALGYCGLIWLLAWQFFGCAARPVNLGGKDYPDLRATPFFPQKKYQCGPASLAMVLAASGVHVRPEMLVPLTYVPERQGSFQPELLAAARTFGRIPYVIDPSFNALTAELTVGRPVLVLQNYGLDLLSAYHYAVVIGLQPGEKVILRSGTAKRQTMNTRLFLMSWLRPGAWGMVVLRPGELPENADPNRYIQGLAAFENATDPLTAEPAFRVALSRWPGDSLFLFAAGNNALKRNSLAEAENYFRKSLKTDPEHLGAMNNLAHTLALQGCFHDAEKMILQAKNLAEQKKSVLIAQILLTRKEIRNLAETKGPVKRGKTHPPH